MTDPSRDAVAHFGKVAPKFHALYDASPAFRERLEVWRDIFERRAPRSGRALDMGCGTGVFSFLLAERGWRVVGVDGAPEMVAFCEEQRRTRGLEQVRFIQGHLPGVAEEELGEVDLVVGSSVLEFVEDLDGAVAFLARVLKPDGLLVVSMPNALSLSRAYERLEFRLTGKPDIYRFIRHFSTPARLRDHLARHGLVLDETRHYAHSTRIARGARLIGLPAWLTEDLFVAVFRKAGTAGGA